MIAAGVFSCSSLVCGDDGAPRELPISNDARPIDLNAPDLNLPPGSAGTLRFSTSAETPSNRQGDTLPSAAVLRWKSRQSERGAASTGFTVRQASDNWQDRGRKNGAMIQPAAHEDAPAPFRDPFGDQSPNSAAPIRLLPPGVAATGGEGLSVVQTAAADDPAPAPPAPWTQKSESPQQKSSILPRNGSTVPPARPFAAQKPSPDLQLPSWPPSEPELPDFRLPAESVKPVQPAEPAKPVEPAESGAAKKEAAPATPRTPPGPSIAAPYQLPEPEEKETDTSCQRVYNGRNCCEEDRKCQTARQALRDNAITKISLDITAPFKPDAASVEEEQQAREDQLRQMPARDWRDRAGQIVATGRLTAISNRKIQVTAADGNVATVPLGTLSEDDTCFLSAWWGVPTECSLGDDPFDPRFWEPVTFTWKASALCHKPLYFEEVALERYGHTMGPVLGPVHSGAHFFLNIAFLPYKMGINPPHECQYALGYYRPGNCAPWLVPPVPISLRGALMQGAAAVGLVYLFP